MGMLMVIAPKKWTTTIWNRNSSYLSLSFKLMLRIEIRMSIQPMTISFIVFFLHFCELILTAST